MYFPILFGDRWYVVYVNFGRKWCIILDSCSQCFGVDLAFQKAVRDDFVSTFPEICPDR